MHLAPHLIRPEGGGIKIDGPQGTVRLRLNADRVVAKYTGNELANGSARAYAAELLSAARQTVETFPLPWTYDSQGRQRITNSKQFYEQTFRSDLQGIERLKRWTSCITTQAD
ncbi:MAG: hypothetical protein ACN4GF_07295 [Lentimonas sp.]